MSTLPSRFLQTLALVLALSTAAAAADVYPSKPVRLIVPFPPGGSNDIVGRMIAVQLTDRLGKQVIVDNRAGAGGVLGTEVAAKSPPDGHTLLLISSFLPEVPTIAEAGVPGYEATNWWGIVTPAGTPGAIIDRLHKELSVVLTSPETQKRFMDEGAEVAQMAPADFGRFIAAETAKWARVVKEAGIRAE